MFGFFFFKNHLEDILLYLIQQAAGSIARHLCVEKYFYKLQPPLGSFGLALKVPFDTRSVELQ
jgi:hypothetical protein